MYTDYLNHTITFDWRPKSATLKIEYAFLSRPFRYNRSLHTRNYKHTGRDAQNWASASGWARTCAFFRAVLVCPFSRLATAQPRNTHTNTNANRDSDTRKRFTRSDNPVLLLLGRGHDWICCGIVFRSRATDCISLCTERICVVLGWHNC